MLRNLEVGTQILGGVNLIMQFCFATVIQGLAKLTLGKKDEARGIQGEGQMLTSSDVSSLVIDRLCDRARGQNVAVACFYFDFAARKEQSPTSMLGAMVKQVLGGLEEVPREISQAYEDQKKVIGGRGPQLSDIVKMLRTTSSERLTFICIDAMDECVPEHRIKILDSLDQILKKSPGTRIFMTGRQHVQAEIGERLSGRVASIAITPRKGDVIGYLHTRLKEDTNPDAVDSILEADILRKIPEDVSEMYVGVMTLRKPPQVVH